jgi:hypothetical protein
MLAAAVAGAFAGEDSLGEAGPALRYDEPLLAGRVRSGGSRQDQRMKACRAVPPGLNAQPITRPALFVRAA